MPAVPTLCAEFNWAVNGVPAAADEYGRHDDIEPTTDRGVSALYWQASATRQRGPLSIETTETQ
jgi:hypothetical protein